MNDSPILERRILLGITGSVAAYKACDLVRKLKAHGARLKTIMTANACMFLSQTLIQSLTHDEVLTDMFSPRADGHAHHVFLSGWADLVLVAPATANIIGKAATGIADDLLSATLLCAMPNILFAPAMHASMYASPVLQNNIKNLQHLGCHFVGPEQGPLAGAEEGVGRLAQVTRIIDKAGALVSQQK